jgi:hypothetical protein
MVRGTNPCLGFSVLVVSLRFRTVIDFGDQPLPERVIGLQDLENLRSIKLVLRNVEDLGLVLDDFFMLFQPSQNPGILRLEVLPKRMECLFPG